VNLRSSAEVEPAYRGNGPPSVKRRTLLTAAAAIALAPLTRIAHAVANGTQPAQAFLALDSVSRLEIGGGRLEVAFAPGEFALSRSEIMDWIASCAQAVAGYYGRFPVERVRILVRSVDGVGVRGGRAFGHDGAAIRFSLGRESQGMHLERDWVLTHEMVHLAFPSVDQQHHWIEEGLATYVEPVARAQAGLYAPERVWGDLVRGLPQGLPQPGDSGLDHTPTWGRTYWGGALYCVLAEIEIRRRTENRFGLQHALRAIVEAGGNMESHWPLRRALRVGDEAVGAPVLAELYDRMRDAPYSPDLSELWQSLGVIVREGRTRFNDSAPLAQIRRAITAPPSATA
jgi:Peptidase of plants and bacteria